MVSLDYCPFAVEVPAGSSIGYNVALLWSRILLELAERN
ncbi:hypothetical protein SLEP1_g53853 [Rubroshorea leprosula]|uniref:Uncharacterized protein n=1 Tax=Rubroshorea leprosula TaxID=152421 RepID=A0AAV5MDG1_9ROSI|nr:hypothetical protein SLEP1_g53853 [Rubroshorea leprosula]